MIRQNKGLSFVEYAIILSVVAAAFIGMNTYIKRGLQGKVKDMTDAFISPVQEGEPSPGVYAQSKSSTTSDMVSTTRLLRGGGTSSNLQGTTIITGSSRSEEYAGGEDKYDFISSKKGLPDDIVRASDSEFKNEDLEASLVDSKE
ncbi:MAG: hypothetical protein MUF05_06600 [Candidatus Omnitrophica bacterium]|jgi:Flp pilus assembly pilin Flp|nr:hypothetical protein [Candidatus Omnitrophota bacterium]